MSDVYGCIVWLSLEFSSSADKRALGYINVFALCLKQSQGRIMDGHSSKRKKSLTNPSRSGGFE